MTRFTMDTLDKIMSAKWCIAHLVDHGIHSATIRDIRRQCDVHIGPNEATRIILLGVQEYLSENDEDFQVMP